jgi:hypothetical protein
LRVIAKLPLSAPASLVTGKTLATLPTTSHHLLPVSSDTRVGNVVASSLQNMRFHGQRIRTT